jgi:quercetin dioxygenase-like cupin family protein
VRACRTASIFAFGALFVAFGIGACREPAPVTVPPLTTAHPSASVLASDLPASELKGDAGAPTPLRAGRTSFAWIEGTKKLEPEICSRLFIVAAKGTVKVGNDSLASGDTLVILHPEPVEVKVTGLALSVTETFSCAVLSRPEIVKTIIRGKDVPELRWAGGAMRAHLDVGTKVSPEVYLGRLEGTASVPEHDHPTSNETIAAIEAAGTFTVNGTEHRLGPRQIVTVPKGTKHSYRPDPGSKLVAIQIYDPPGPEQRFVALAAAEKDAGPDKPEKPEKR